MRSIWLQHRSHRIKPVLEQIEICYSVIKQIKKKKNGASASAHLFRSVASCVRFSAHAHIAQHPDRLIDWHKRCLLVSLLVRQSCS